MGKTKSLEILQEMEKGEVFNGIHGHINELDEFLFNHIDVIEKIKADLTRSENENQKLRAHIANQRREIKDISAKATKHQNWLSEKTGKKLKKEPENLKALDEIISDVIDNSSNLIENQKHELDNLKEEKEF